MIMISDNSIKDHVITCKIINDCLLSDHLAMDCVIRCKTVPIIVIDNGQDGDALGSMKWDKKCMITKFVKYMQNSGDVLNDHLCFEQGCMNEGHMRAIAEEYKNCISFLKCIE